MPSESSPTEKEDSEPTAPSQRPTYRPPAFIRRDSERPDPGERVAPSQPPDHD